MIFKIIKLKKYIFTLLVLFIVIFTLFPILWTLLTSLKPSDGFYRTTASLIPEKLTTGNYKLLIKDVTFLKSIVNSTIVAISVGVISLIASLMAAYACSRYRFVLKRPILIILLLTYMCPQVLLIMPLYSTMKTIGLLGTYLAVIIAYCTFTIPFSTWLLTGYLNDIPFDMEEAALIDGCTRLSAFIKTILPIAIPGIIATLVYIFIFSWNEFIFASMFTTRNTRTLPIKVYDFTGEYLVNWPMLTAAGLLACVPVLIFFVLVQNKLIEGLTAGAVKG